MKKAKTKTAPKKRARSAPKKLHSKQRSKSQAGFWRLFVPRSVLPGVVFVFIFGSIGIYLLLSSHAASIKPIWAVSTGNLQQLANAGASATLLQRAFGGSANYMLSFGPSPDKPIDGIIGIPVKPYDSYTDPDPTKGILAALTTGALPGPSAWWDSTVHYAGAVYDNEKWSATPTIEQLDPITYMTKTSMSLHANSPRLLSINAPGVSLVYAAPPPIGGSSPFDAYISRGYAKAAAQNADVYVIQAEGTEHDQSTFETFVSEAATQARQANPSVKILVDMSTLNNGYVPPYQQFHDEYWYVRNNVPDVNGFWISDPDPTNSWLWIKLLQSDYGNV